MGWVEPAHGRTSLSRYRLRITCTNPGGPNSAQPDFGCSSFKAEEARQVYHVCFVVFACLRRRHSTPVAHERKPRECATPRKEAICRVMTREISSPRLPPPPENNGLSEELDEDGSWLPEAAALGCAQLRKLKLLESSGARRAAGDHAGRSDA